MGSKLFTPLLNMGFLNRLLIFPEIELFNQLELFLNAVVQIRIPKSEIRNPNDAIQIYPQGNMAHLFGEPLCFYLHHDGGPNAFHH